MTYNRNEHVCGVETHLTQEEMDDINRFLNENYDMLVILS